MKKTKTGLHIQTRKNRIEVYTKKDLERQEQERQEKRALIISFAILLFASLTFVLGIIVGISS